MARMNMASLTLLVVAFAFAVAPHCVEARQGVRVLSAGQTLRRYLKGNPKQGMHGTKNGRIPGMHLTNQSSGNGRKKGLHCNRNASICFDPAQNPVAGATTCCSRTCFNVGNNPLHCGKCFNKCAAGLTCCSGTCVPLLTNDKNCGSCGKQCVKTRCHWGVCGYGSPPPAPPPPSK